MYRFETRQFPAIAPFAFQITEIEIDALDPRNVHTAHSHRECEIYVNLSGDVSFMVEGHQYPVAPGNAIITRPYEMHHCVYHSNAPHHHFWILFSCAGNEPLLDFFLSRVPGTGNRAVLNDADSGALIDCCRALGAPGDAGTLYGRFFRMLTLLRRGISSGAGDDWIPPEIAPVLDAMNRHFAQPLSVADLAHDAGMSVATLERSFRRQTGLTPRDYLLRKRLANACRLLDEGASVQEACDRSGFSDCSRFIAQFRAHCGRTPLQYKKRDLSEK